MKYLSLALLPASLLLTGCVGNADDPGVPSASWYSVATDGTRAPRPATPQVEKDRPGLSADDVSGAAVADPIYDRFRARVAGRDSGLEYPKKPFEPPASSVFSQVTPTTDAATPVPPPTEPAAAPYKTPGGVP